MTTPSNEPTGGVSLAHGQENKYRVITGCAPSPKCPECQAGHKRLRDTRRDGKVKTVQFKHIALRDDGEGRMRPGLTLCADQAGPEQDLTGQF